jgi:hypothetical protein
MLPAMSNIDFIQMHCPHVWTLLNQKAKSSLPTGLENFLSDDMEAQSQLRSADARISRLIAKTTKKKVADAYKRDLSGIGTEQQVAELFCEISLVGSLADISHAPPDLRPSTRNGKYCDAKVIICGRCVYCEVKRLADPWKGGMRSIARSPKGSKPPDASRPRAMDLFSKLKDVPAQLPQGTLNILFLFHPSIWNSHANIRQALFGDASESGEALMVFDNGLFALDEWREVSACLHSRINANGTLSVVQTWQNPNANVCLPADVLKRIKTDVS